MEVGNENLWNEQEMMAQVERRGKRKRQKNQVPEKESQLTAWLDNY